MSKNDNRNNGKEKTERPKKNWLGLETETKNGILAVFFFALAIITILSYFDLAGIFGQYFVKGARIAFGKGIFLITAALILGGISVLRSLHKDIYKTTLLGMLIFLFSFLGILFVLIGGSEPIESGGYLGYAVSYPFLKLLGIYASLIIFIAFLISAVLIALDISLNKLLSVFIVPFRRKKQEEVETVEDLPLEESEKGGVLGQIAEMGKKILPKPNFRVRKIDDENGFGGVDEDGVVASSGGALSAAGRGAARHTDVWRPPPVALLESDQGKPSSGDIKANANIIQRTLAHFGVEVEMGETKVGPTVTQYTLKPAQGIKLSRITVLVNDLALSLAAHPLRIEAPIPGRSWVGIEVPNRVITRVRLKNLLDDKAFVESHTLLTMALGRNVAGIPVYCALEKMPHMLIAGATGSGKTICLNTIILSFLYRHSPERLRLILIDPKRVEFPVYKDIPHLLTPVVVEPEKTVNALQWGVGEMERRFNVLAGAGSRDIISYNSKRLDDPMPYVVIIIDELADLMAAYGREVEAAIVRLAQMSRAVGIHLIVCTQRPSVDVITGLIKANITSRIALQVASQIDSRTILDMSGAEKLLGNGDMLYLAGDAGKPVRLQGAFISEEETKRVADFVRSSEEPVDYQTEVTEHQRSTTLWGGKSDEDIDDELYEEAKEVVLAAGKASASLLQRRLRIGYARAARLLDMLEEQGIIGPGEGAKPRQILISQPANDSQKWYEQYDNQEEA
ncbi:MAG: DNA translocase FtsK 4TM domain-containing protein [Candidatus Portnoybacteria bacterium]|nr:DNA translocase FtsK 4TM domain-containing protein [Candidatus Portnoybacteria bacterium]